MNITKKAAAVVLCVAMLSGMSSCSSKIDPDVIESAGLLAEAITKLDYSKIEALASEGDSELESILSLPSSSDEEHEAKSLIASTLSYEVDSDSYEGHVKGGSVDIIFTYVDYSSVTDDVLFLSGSDLCSAIESCEDTVEVTLNFDFSKTKAGVLCSNISAASELFPYASAEFEFALPYCEYAGYITMDEGDLVAGEYIFSSEPSSISGSLEIEGDGSRITWDYYWIIEDEYGSYVDGTSALSESCPSALYFESPYSVSSYPNGSYTVSFYSSDYQLIASQAFSVDIEMEDDSSSSSYSSSFADYFVCPDDGIIELPNTDIVIDLPDGVTCRTQEELVADLGDAGAASAHLLFFANDDLTMVYAERLTTGGYSSASSISCLFDIVYDQEDWIDSGGALYETEFYTIVIGDREFNAATISVEAGGGDWYNVYIVIGDGDTSYLITVYSADEGFMDRFIGGISVA